jgi:hypothetical protein
VLNEDRRDARGLDVGLEQSLDGCERVVGADAVIPARERRVVDLAGKRAEAGLVGRDFPGHRERHHRATVKRSGECDHRGTTSRGARDLHRVLDRLGASAEEDRLLWKISGREGVEPLG